jgi:hypothetical protein
MNNTAHFFWHGQLSTLEKSCIQSFYNHGFKPVLWSYNNIHIDNIEIRNASDVLSQDHLTKYAQGGQSPSLAAFADVFRINLLNRYDGWWFDTDCYCLKNYDEFHKLDQQSPIVIGFEDDESIACGVLKYSKELSKIFLSELNTLLIKYNNHLPEWGMIGPRLFTDCIKKNNLINNILSPEYFYPIHYSNFNKLYSTNTEDVMMVDNKIKNSYIIHLWNEFISRSNINKFDNTINNSWINKNLYQ